MIELCSVNVGLPAVIGMRRGRPVLSGIRKQPVQTASVAISLTNLEGDAQADLRVHGGSNKAVYAYSADHYSWWTAEMRPDQPYRPGSFGENLTITGLDETGVCLGDLWQWGTAVLQVCQPRYPCYKLALATGRPKIVKRFVESGRSGWYLRVIEAGTGPVAGPIELARRDPVGITIREAALAVANCAEPERILEIATHPALAPGWASMLRHQAIASA